jgi:predicted nucleic acid-binding protein
VRLFTTKPRRLTHSYVLAELVALCNARRLPRAASLAFVADLMDNPHVEMHWVDQPTFTTSLALLQARPDKAYSQCDAVSFILMRENGVTESLTTDHHFEQEGFIRLLKP